MTVEVVVDHVIQSNKDWKTVGEKLVEVTVLVVVVSIVLVVTVVVVYVTVVVYALVQLVIVVVDVACNTLCADAERRMSANATTLTTSKQTISNVFCDRSLTTPSV